MKMSMQLKEIRPAGMLKSKFAVFVRIALKEAAQIWIDQMLPGHFQPGAGRKYGYKPRTRRYLYIKLKTQGRMVKDYATGKMVQRAPNAHPLVWTGAMQRALVRGNAESFGARARVTANIQTVTMRLPLPHPIRPAMRGPKADGSWSEITRMTPSEVSTLMTHVVARVREQIYGWGATGTTVIR